MMRNDNNNSFLTIIIISYEFFFKSREDSYLFLCTIINR